jgi:hypothetical protein
MSSDTPKVPLQWFDTVAMVVAALSATGLTMVAFAGRTFLGMYDDLGSRERIPALTLLATSAWFPLVLALAAAAALGLSRKTGTPPRRHRMWILASLAVGSAGFIVCLVGLFLPILGLAAAIQGY